MFRFERLDIWQRSVAYADAVYKATEAFPRKEQFGLTSQVTRAAVSVSANIAEGSSRNSRKDFARFIEIAFGSLCETVSHLQIAKLQGFLSADRCTALYDAAEELGRMLSAFKNRLTENSIPAAAAR